MIAGHRSRGMGWPMAAQVDRDTNAKVNSSDRGLPSTVDPSK